MPVHLLKSLLMPALILLAVNLAAFAWRAIPQSDSSDPQDTSWQTLESAGGIPDVRSGLLAGGHWGQPASNPGEQGEGAEGSATDSSSEATVQAMSQHIQRQLQGIIRRGDWVLLFAQPASGSDRDALALPLELRSGDALPGTPWHIGQIWADRIQLLQDGHDPLIVPLYPIAESVTES